MKTYNVTVSHTGGIKVKANSALDASKKVNSMKKVELEKLASFCDYEVTDVCEIPEPVYYYSATVSGTDVKYFFHTEKVFENDKQVIDHLVATKKIIRPKQDVFWTNYPEESDYREEIISYLKLCFDKEREEYHNKLRSQSFNDIIFSVGKIQFFDDMIAILDDKENDDEFDLTSVEKLLETTNPLDYLYEAHYCKIDFSSANEQMISIFNLEG